MEDKVHFMLTEILGLHLEQEKMVLEDPRKATLVRSEMFRKLAIIDALLISQDPPEAISSKKTLMDLVTMSKMVVKAGAVDLKKMAIPHEEDKGNQLFVNYMELPPEVRKLILGKLTSAADKLAVSTAIPEDFEMMMDSWGDIATLQFELTFPTRMERYEFDWEELVSLCRSNNHIRDVIVGHFGTTLGTFKNLRGIVLGPSIHPSILSDLGDLNPIPFQIVVGFSFSMHEGIRRETLSRLDEIGTGIWDCYINLSDTSAMEALQMIREYLLRMPNVRRLTVMAGVVFEPIIENFEVLENLQLPELPHLETLCFRYLPVSYDVYRLCQGKILKKYGRGLRYLQVDSLHPELIRAVTISPPMNLSVLELYGDCGTTVFEDCLIFVEACVGSPLKTIKLAPGYFEDANGILFTKMLAALSKFSGTLEELQLQMHRSRQGDTFHPVFLADVDLPRLKTMTIVDYPGIPAFLCQCPSLEKLNMVNWGTKVEEIESYLEISGIPYLSGNRESVPQANIWKLSPYLETITLLRYKGLRETEKIYEVTRSGDLTVYNA